MLFCLMNSASQVGEEVDDEDEDEDDGRNPFVDGEYSSDDDSELSSGVSR